MENTPMEKQNNFTVKVEYNKDFIIPLDFDSLKKEFVTDDPYKLLNDLKYTASDISGMKHQLNLAIEDYSTASKLGNQYNAKLWMIKSADIYKDGELQNSFRWL